MTQPPAPNNTPLSPEPSATGRLPNTPPARARRGCGAQLLATIGWLLTLALSVALALAAVAAIAYFLFGFTLATPNQLRQASADVGALQAQVATLESEASQLRGNGSEASESLGEAVARVEELESQLALYEEQAAALAQQATAAVTLSNELDENIAVAATIQAEGRENQVLVAVVATVQADNAARLAELQQRTERINRFLQRLGDLAGDATIDGGEPLPTGTPGAPQATPTPAAEDETPEPSSTPALTPTATRTP
jgi:septal ring factor EnvC (AmiA/AmiB activator)